jgi:hypothetical protein
MDSKILCEQITPQLDAFRDDELTADEKAIVEQHLTDCSDCKTKLAAINRVFETLRTMPRLAASVGLSAKLDGIIDRPMAPQNVVPISRKLWMPVAAAAAVAAIVFGAKFAVPGTQPAAVIADSTASQSKPAHQAPAAQPGLAPQERIATEVETISLPTPAAHHTAAAPGKDLRKHTSQHELNHVAPKPQIANNSQPLHTSGPDNGAKVATYVPEQNEPGKTTKENNRSQRTEVELAELPSGSSFGDAIGIATDEDGLYDIKM